MTTSAGCSFLNPGEIPIVVATLFIAATTALKTREMSRANSMDLRGCAMTRLDEGQTVRQVAKAWNVAPSSVVKRSQRRRETGSCATAMRSETGRARSSAITRPGC